MSADPALALTVAYLQLNGYFLLTEQELHIREPVGFRTLTDIDIIALRPPIAPGSPHHQLGQRVEGCLIVTDVDPTLSSRLHPGSGVWLRPKIIAGGFWDIALRGLHSAIVAERS